MEYQFKTDINGQPTAKCELDCEAFGDWLTNDIGKNRAQLTALIISVEQALKKAVQFFELTTQGYHLEIELEEVTLSLRYTSHNSSHDESLFHDQDDHTDNEDNSPATGCGLADFHDLLKGWQAFIG